MQEPLRLGCLVVAMLRAPSMWGQVPLATTPTRNALGVALNTIGAWLRLWAPAINPYIRQVGQSSSMPILVVTETP